jgi:hypothetical protein
MILIELEFWYNYLMEKAKEDDFDDDDCEVCRLMRTGNVTPEALEKAFSLQNFLNNFPQDQGEKK